MTLENVERNDLILGGVAVLLAIDLLVLPWFELSFGPISVTSTGTGAPDGWLGVLAALAALAVAADVAIEKFSPQTRLPSIGAGRASTRLVLAGVTALCVALKFLFHIHFGLFGIGFWGAAVLTVALAVLAVKARQAQGPVTAGTFHPSH